MKPFQYFFGILIFVVVAIIAVVKQIQVYELGYRQSKSEQEINKTEEDIRILRNKIAAKKKLSYLKKQAETYGMQIIPPEDVPSD